MKKTGLDLIAIERTHQEYKLGYTPEHDDKHWNEELASAAVAYATPGKSRLYNSEGLPQGWPFDKEYWKPYPECRIRELTKAGALIAAEIDRLQRQALRKKDKEVTRKLLDFYYKLTYTGVGSNTQEDFDWVDNNTFKCVVTEQRAKNGYQYDQDKVAQHLVIDKPYTLLDMNVSRSSSTLRLKEFPNITFNTVNFKIYLDNE